MSQLAFNEDGDPIELSPADQRAWIEQLSAMSVSEAVERVRALLAASNEEAA